jgi:hypothetical protein
MSRFDVPDLGILNGELGVKIITMLANGDVMTQILTAKTAQEGMSNFGMRKMEYHLGELNESNMLDAVINAKTDVVNSLAHETTHLDEVKEAYNTLIEALEEYRECMNDAIHRSASNN